MNPGEAEVSISSPRGCGIEWLHCQGSRCMALHPRRIPPHVLTGLNCLNSQQNQRKTQFLWQSSVWNIGSLTIFLFYVFLIARGGQFQSDFVLPRTGHRWCASTWKAQHSLKWWLCGWSCEKIRGGGVEVVMRTTWPPLLTRTVIIGTEWFSEHDLRSGLWPKTTDRSTGQGHRNALGSPLHSALAHWTRCPGNQDEPWVLWVLGDLWRSGKYQVDLTMSPGTKHLHLKLPDVCLETH
jgi:hypothetical protein